MEREELTLFLPLTPIRKGGNVLKEIKKALGIGAKKHPKPNKQCPLSEDVRKLWCKKELCGYYDICNVQKGK